MTDNKKRYLEFVRGLAAIEVVLYHYSELYSENFSKPSLFSNWGKDAVMIFFILSGCVINISQTNKPKSRNAFLANRLIRLYPQFIIGLILGIAVIVILQTNFPSVEQILGNVLMLSTLQGYIVKCIHTNSPVWSLTFEMFFYLVFAITIGVRQKKMMLIWFLLSIAVLPLYYYKMQMNVAGHFIAMAAFSSIWIMGYYIYEFRNRFYVDVYAAVLSAGLLPLISRLHVSDQYYDPLKYLFFAIFAIPFFRYCLQSQPEGRKMNTLLMLPFYGLIVALIFLRSDSMFISKLIYSAIPMLLVLAVYVAKKVQLQHKLIAIVNKVGGTTGKYSYSLYIIHYPIQILFASLFKTPFLFFAVSLPCIILLAFGLENYLQPAIVKYLKKS